MLTNRRLRLNVVSIHMYIDTHAHLNFKAFENDWEEVIGRAQDAQVSHIITVGTNLETSQQAISIASKHKQVYASIGIHPHHAKGYLKEADPKASITRDVEMLIKLMGASKVVAIGEIGLDQHMYKNSQYEVIASEEEMQVLNDLQRILFSLQLRLAADQKLPIIVHSREARDMVLKELEKCTEQGFALSGVFHCFDGSKKYAKKILDAGFHISFTGNLTRDEGRQQVSNVVPLERLLLETDAPYMTPLDAPTHRNEPANVTIIAQKHAQLRNISVEEIASKTSHNAMRLFALD